MPTTISPAPTPLPSPSDPDNFDALADDQVNWQVTELAPKASLISQEVSAASTATESNRLIAETAAQIAAAATGYLATSPTSVSLTTGAKAITLVEASRIFANGDRVSLIRRSDRNARASGLVSSANMGAKTMTVTIDGTPPGGGPYTDWLIIIDGLEPFSRYGGKMLGRLGLYAATMDTLTVASAVLDFSKDFLIATVSANTTFTATNIPSGTNEATPIAIEITVTGSYTITFPGASFDFVGGAAQPLAAGKHLLTGYAKGGIVNITGYAKLIS